MKPNLGLWVCKSLFCKNQVDAEDGPEDTLLLVIRKAD